MTCQSAAPECQPSYSLGSLGQIAGDCSIKALTTHVQANVEGQGKGHGAGAVVLRHLLNEIRAIIAVNNCDPVDDMPQVTIIYI